MPCSMVFFVNCDR